MHTQIGAEYVEPDSGCWCCGDRTVRESLAALSAFRGWRVLPLREQAFQAQA